MSNGAEWYFPVTEHGKWRGLTNPAGEHFTGDRIAGSVRETLQNSLDSPDEGSSIVTVKISEIAVDLDCFGGKELCKHFESCLKEESVINHEDSSYDLKTAVQTLKNSSIRCLAIVDEGTTGLCKTKDGDKWEALVNSGGVVLKDDHSGGSFGIGKKCGSAAKRYLYCSLLNSVCGFATRRSS